MLKTGIFFSSYGYEGVDFESIMSGIAAAGFDSFSTYYYDAEKTEQICKLAVKYGVEYESVHAPFGGISSIWSDGEAGDEWVERLEEVAKICSDFGIKYYTVHCANTGKYNNNGPYGSLYTEIGFERFRRIVDASARLGVKASLENVEFPQRELKSLTEALRATGSDGWGITWDVGHWNCYPSQLDFASTFGDRLIGTHVHDNFGNTDSQVITWEDDCHILPFDGTIDYREVGKTLKGLNYGGSITLEVGRSKLLPWYEDYGDIESFLRAAHERASHVARLCE